MSHGQPSGSTPKPFPQQARLRHMATGALGTVLLSEDYNGDMHLDDDEDGTGIVARGDWHEYEMLAEAR